MCPKEDRWYDYKYDLVDPAERSDMARHLEQCPSCSEYLQALNRAALELDAMADRTSCPDDATWGNALAGALAGPELRVFEDHLAVCERCRQQRKELEDLLQAAEDEAIPLPPMSARRAHFEQAMAAVQAQTAGNELEPSSSRFFGASLRAWGAWATAAVLLIVLGGGAFYFRQQSVWTSKDNKTVRDLVESGSASLLRAFGTVPACDLRLSGGFVRSGRDVMGGLGEREERERAHAETALLKAWQLRPDDSATNHALGRYYLATQQFERAEKYLLAALRRADRSAPLQNDLGVLAYSQGRYREAMRYFDAAMALNPDYPEPIFNAAFLRIRIDHNAQDAEPLIVRYRRLEPDSLWLADLERELKQIRP